jgi:hypothetical protein
VCRASKIQHEDLTSAGVRLPILVVDGTFFYGLWIFLYLSSFYIFFCIVKRLSLPVRFELLCISIALFWSYLNFAFSDYLSHNNLINIPMQNFRVFPAESVLLRRTVGDMLFTSYIPVNSYPVSGQPFSGQL